MSSIKNQINARRLNVALFCLGFGISFAVTLSVFTSTSIPAAIGLSALITFGWMFSYIFGELKAYFAHKRQNADKKKEQADINKELNEFNKSLLLIGAERKSIIKTIYDFDDWCEHYVASLPSSKVQKVFPDDIDSPIEFSAEIIEFGEIRRQLTFLINNYPDFNKKLASELSYVRRIAVEFSEHHAQVMLLAEEFLKRAHNTQYQALKNSKPTKSSKFFKPVDSTAPTTNIDPTPDEFIDPPEDVRSNTFSAA